MAIPDYGAAPLAKTWLITRGLTFIAMIIIVGLTANFVAEIVSSNVNPPSEIVGTLVITCLAALYCLISVPFFWARANLGLLIMAGCDGALLLAFIVVAVVLGKPLSFLNCNMLANASQAADARTASQLAQALAQNAGLDGSKLGFAAWIGVTKTNCYETKALWGLCIALCILFFCSALLLPTMWFKVRRLGRGGKSVA